MKDMRIKKNLEIKFNFKNNVLTNYTLFVKVRIVFYTQPYQTNPGDTRTTSKQLIHPTLLKKLSDVK